MTDAQLPTAPRPSACQSVSHSRRTERVIVLSMTCCLIGSLLQGSASGTTIIRTKLADGSLFSQLPGGASTTMKPDRTVITRLPEGVTFTVYPDGTTFTELPGGGKITKHPNGATTTRLPDGTTIKIGGDVNLKITLPTTGRVAKDKEGNTTVTQPDGTTTTISPSGDTVTKKPGGLVIYTNGASGVGASMTIFPSDTSISVDPRSNSAEIVYPDNTRIRIDPDGTITTKYPDGRTEIQKAPATAPVGAPPALKVAPLNPTRPPTGQIVLPGFSTSSATKTPSPSSPVPIPYPNSNFQIQLGGLPTKTVAKVDIPVTANKTGSPAPSTSPQRAFGIVPRGVEDQDESALPVLDLQEAAQFLAGKKGTVTVPAGRYSVVEANGRLQLTPVGSTTGKPISLASQPAAYEESMEGSALLWLPTEQQDYQLLLLLGPDGRARYTVTPLSGVRTRGVLVPPMQRQFLLPGKGLLRLAPIPPTGAKPTQSSPLKAPLRIVTCGLGMPPPTSKPTPPQASPPARDSDCRDLNPGSLHVIVGNMLGMQSQGLGEDRAGMTEVTPRSMESNDATAADQR